MTRHGYHMFFFIQYSYMGQNIILEDNDIHLLTLLSSDTETVTCTCKGDTDVAFYGVVDKR